MWRLSFYNKCYFTKWLWSGMMIMIRSHDNDVEPRWWARGAPWWWLCGGSMLIGWLIVWLTGWLIDRWSELFLHSWMCGMSRCDRPPYDTSSFTLIRRLGAMRTLDFETVIINLLIDGLSHLFAKPLYLYIALQPFSYPSAVPNI